VSFFFPPWRKAGPMDLSPGFPPLAGRLALFFFLPGRFFVLNRCGVHDRTALPPPLGYTTGDGFGRDPPFFPHLPPEKWSSPFFPLKVDSFPPHLSGPARSICRKWFFCGLLPSPPYPRRVRFSSLPVRAPTRVGPPPP